jgi:hypothetical protein
MRLFRFFRFCGSLFCVFFLKGFVSWCELVRVKTKQGKRRKQTESKKNMHHLGSRNQTTDDIATRSGSNAVAKQ